MTAKYNGKEVYVVKVEKNKEYALISYYEDKSRVFKVDIDELKDPSEMLKAEILREPL